MKLTEQQIANLAPKPTAFKAGQKLASLPKWTSFALSDRAMWGEIKGSGSKPYKTQIDVKDLAYKCSCPSRQFPCKHSLGLLLLYSQNESNFEASSEPDWVKEWIDKRQAKAAAPKKEEKELTPEDIAKSEKGKQKRADARMKSVKAGVSELELWLRDLVRLGFLHLPNKPRGDFQKVAARMMDAKAPGLAGWVRAFEHLDYADRLAWQEEALVLSGKLNLLIQTFKNYDQLDPLWQLSIRNLIGWNQSTKDLLANKEIKGIKDEWLVIGQEKEENDDLVVERNWLWGTTSNRSALILNFGSRFAPLISTISPGIIIQGELKFFPNVMEQRAVIQNQRAILPNYRKEPKMESGWKVLRNIWRDVRASYPWVHSIPFLIEEVQIVQTEGGHCIVDRNGALEILHPDFDNKQLMGWMVISGNGPVKLAGLFRNGKILPLGIFSERNYLILEKEESYVEGYY